MQAALMVPCYIDMFYPHVGIVTIELLEKLGVDVVYPKCRTCCRQPRANSGCYEEARATEEHCARVFGLFDCVVTPSGSCTHHIRDKFTAAADSPEKHNLVRNTYDRPLGTTASVTAMQTRRCAGLVEIPTKQH